MKRKRRIVYSRGNRYKTRRINGKVFRSNESFFDKSYALSTATKYRSAWGMECRVIQRKATESEKEIFKHNSYGKSTTKMFDLWTRGKR